MSEGSAATTSFLERHETVRKGAEEARTCRADSIFRIGGDHAVCQDYALHDKERGQWAIVCDGCSSSPHTDFGARILAWSARIHLGMLDAGGIYNSASPQASIGAFFERVAQQSEWSVIQSHLPAECLDATLLVAVTDGDYFLAACYGDGILGFLEPDNSLQYETIEFDGNMPYYLNYLNHASRCEQFIANACNTRRITSYRWREERVEAQPVYADNIQGGVDFHYVLGRCENHSGVFLLTDGADSFLQAETRSSRPSSEAVRELLAFKNTTGEFVQRRVRRMEKDWAKAGYVHYDDLAVAGIWFG